MLHEEANYGTNFLMPLIIIKKKASINTVLDAGRPNSKTNQPPGYWPLGFLATQPARAYKKQKSVIDLL